MEQELSETGEEVDDVSDAMKDGEKATLSFSDVLKANLLGDAITMLFFFVCRRQ